VALRFHEHALREIMRFVAVARDAQTPGDDLRVMTAEELQEPDARPPATRSEVIRDQVRIRQRFQKSPVIGT
jgi:hypothetical protein